MNANYLFSRRMITFENSKTNSNAFENTKFPLLKTQKGKDQFYLEIRIESTQILSFSLASDKQL